MRCHEQGEHPEMSRRAHRWARPRARFPASPFRRASWRREGRPARAGQRRVRDAGGAREPRERRLRSPTSPLAAARRHRAARYCRQLREDVTRALGAAPPSGLTAEPRVFGGETGATSARIIGPPQASSVGTATATPPRARAGTAAAAIVLAAGPHRGGSRQPWDTRSDAACPVIGACAIDASLFGAASCRSRWHVSSRRVASTSPRITVAG